MKKIVLLVCTISAAFLLIAGCSSSKKGERSAIGRVYQNTTAHYNGFYYAKLKLTEAENQMITSRKYNFDQLLPLFKVGNPDDAAGNNDMDSVIRRLTIVVKLHPDSKWTDDAYLNIGKAYYYKKNYEAALATFQYVSGKFGDKKALTEASNNKKTSTPSKSGSHGKPQSAAQKQKAAEDAEAKEAAKTQASLPSSSSGGLLKHTPVHDEDLFWMARTFTNLGQFSDAQSVLSFMKNKSLPVNLKEEYGVVQTNLFIEQKQYTNAIEPLKSAIASAKDHKDKTRYTYVLAQLYQFTKNYKLASQYFDAITRMKPSYEMEFNSRIAVAKNYVISGAGSPGAISAQLESMVRDDRYEDFYDQIYYELALVNLRQNKEDIAVKNLESSIRKSTSNINQKGLAFLKLGEMDFNEQDYLSASPDYDSAVSFLDAKFDTLDQVKSLQRTLKNLSDQYYIILEQDSLQKLAAMSEKDRNRFIDDLIAEQERQKQEQSRDSVVNSESFQNQQLNNDRSTVQNQAQGSSWYFYNTSLKATGFNEFRQKWGNRKNEDNWRRNNKSSSDITTANGQNTLPGEQQTGAGAENLQKDNAENALSAMLLNIPLTTAKMEASNNKIFDAYYILGTIYKDELHNSAKATETFEKLASRFPENENISRVYYSLYLIYSEKGNIAKAETFKQLLINNYPNSAYAAVLTDPNYLNKAKAQQNALNTYYASTYNYYVAEKYPDVIAHAQAADTLFKDNPLQSKFDLLEAFSIGKLQDTTALIAALDSFIKRYPTGAEHEIAVDLLINLGVEPEIEKPAENISDNFPKKEETKSSPYQYHPDNPQYLVIVFNTISPKTRAVMDSIDNYNSLNYSIDNYKVSSQLLDTKSQMILVKQMKSSKEAIAYYNELSDQDGVFEPVEDLSYELLLIDDKNYPIFYKLKNMDEYRKFFETNYDLDDEGN
ncbi:MAG: tetratricopeptide repeat protein [Chitinophagales bacterium]|nr:tetratricopeptide repeat protein [Chitinophagales bacterium]